MAKPTSTSNTTSTTSRRGDKTPSPSAAAMPPATRAKGARAPQSDDGRHLRISVAAYYRAERRGFAPGGELGDWLAAEKDVDLGTPTDLPLEDNAFPSPK